MKVTIVGGGTAGWLSALFLIQYNKHHPNNPIEISLIESPDIPIIGAGEGSTGFLKNILSYLSEDIEELNEEDFLKRANATYKLGIEFIDWNYIGHKFYSPITPTSTVGNNIDINHLVFSKYNSILESTKNGILWKNNLSPINKNGENYSNYAYHFDAHKVGEYFKEISIKNGVHHITDIVTNLSFDNKGILNKVSLKNSLSHLSDFWIDCSGFNRILINSNKDNWIDYSEYLPTNSAITFHQNFEENKDIKPSTLAKAMPNGWMWQIPTNERYGCGYVYSDNFTNPNEAHQELQNSIKKEIPTFRNIKFSPGRVKNVWKKNILAVGLSSSFLEPLEATSIHSTLAQLMYFMTKHFTTDLNTLLNPKNIDPYNFYFSSLLDEFRDLVQFHYMVQREDTKFWKFIKYDLKRSEKVKEILNLCKTHIPNYKNFPITPGAAGWAVWSWTLNGLGYITPDNIERTLSSFTKYDLQNIYQTQKNINYSNIENFVKHKEIIKFIKNK